jgi:hypothetical protein
VSPFNLADPENDTPFQAHNQGEFFRNLLLNILLTNDGADHLFDDAEKIAVTLARETFRSGSLLVHDVTSLFDVFTCHSASYVPRNSTIPEWLVNRSVMQHLEPCVVVTVEI